ncbi:IS91 family transposase [Rhodocytophaga rosea]|uniref:IS91 family transposase n=1 Tax=Rhodocytophaga rosea TaxID=2704465 RepID=A0A6C0GE25_9BACT|nr:IS91 family transposase [Rhodocytophaga rosea]QHT66167.1 IS91 family transposase [Rhodocytophaga rosea]QHT66179.1 IS91 family transposase [Rhodocytophaga rosea]QHT71644.1 IS91 family transposase [Rhodocytophaga rosea]
MKPALELAHILSAHLHEFMATHAVSAHKFSTLKAIEHCRTARLGGHIDACDSCGYLRISYNSCRNRHCPKCQTTNREKWIMQREADLLPVSYFHVVFTLPHSLNPLCLQYPQELYALLFKTAWSTINSFANNPKHLGAKTGMISILHTWGQNLSLHPHLHCIVPGGGISGSGHWKKARSTGKYLFPVKALSKVFRARYVSLLRSFLSANKAQVDNGLWKELFAKDWVVYCKRPFLGPAQVIEYLGRYTHKVAISNHRLQSIEDGKVSFAYKDYRQEAAKKTMSLEATEFIRRFSLHILPPKFVRIRHYGILSSKAKAHDLALARQDLRVATPEKRVSDWKSICKERLGYDIDLCPCCSKGRMREILRFEAARSPPDRAYLLSIALHLKTA